MDGALAVLAQFLESNLEHVSNKSAYLCGVMKTYRQKSRTGHAGSSLHNGSLNGGGLSGGPANGGSNSSGLLASDGSVSSGGGAGTTANKGPDKNKIKEILDRTGYTLDVTTGQRKYGGPPPDWEGEPPGNGCEVRKLFIYNKKLFTYFAVNALESIRSSHRRRGCCNCASPPFH